MITPQTSNTTRSSNNTTRTLSSLTSSPTQATSSAQCVITTAVCPSPAPSPSVKYLRTAKIIPSSIPLHNSSMSASTTGGRETSARMRRTIQCSLGEGRKPSRYEFFSCFRNSCGRPGAWAQGREDVTALSNSPLFNILLPLLLLRLSLLVCGTQLHHHPHLSHPPCRSPQAVRNLPLKPVITASQTVVPG